MSHITGGGLAANLARVVPATVSVRVDRSTWTPSRGVLAGRRRRRGRAGRPGAALNIGVGMVALVAPTSADDAVRLLGEHGVDAWIAGDVAAAGVARPGGSVTLTGDHA